ncbi:zinc finger protein 131 isoform X2 [Hemibagrus wyckioides]|uniref:zinc finger protein 131 isoform X2 n=1 Tax=Hemibagrus wyckioides TaxID=337641 RepID=UPI00266B3FFB|nr:zinc finger protein 131 isoform X2 [Hemibagrus wyckioides]
MGSAVLNAEEPALLSLREARRCEARSGTRLLKYLHKTLHSPPSRGQVSTMSDDGGVGEDEFPAHYKVMLDKLNEQRQLDQFTDITLIVDGVSNSAFCHLMEFTYTATLALRGQEEVMDVWRAAEYLQMQEAIKALNKRVKSEERNGSLKSEPRPLPDKTKAKKRKIAETSNVITETLPSVEAESEPVEIEVEVGDEAVVQECVMEEEVLDGGRETDDSALALLADITSKYQQGAQNVKKVGGEAGDLQEEAVMATKTLEGIEVVEVQISDNMFRCDKCDRCFKLFYHLKQHMKTHTSSLEKPFVCKHCGKTYAREGALKQHVNTCHYDAEELSKKLKKKVHMCVYCSKEFDHFGHFKEHLRKHTGEKPFECPDCHERFARNSTLKCHMSACQNGAGAKKGRKKLYECQVCDEVFNSWDQFKDHLVIHTGDKPNHCTLCDQWFTHARELTAHLQQQHAVQQEDTASGEERVELEDGVMVEEQVELQDGAMKERVELQGAVIEGRVELQDGVMVEERVIMEGQMELRDGVMMEGQVVLQDGVMEQQMILQDGVVMEGRVELRDVAIDQPVVLQDGVMIEERVELQDGVMVEGRVELQDGVMIAERVELQDGVMVEGRVELQDGVMIAERVELQDGVMVENQVETVLIEVEEDGVKEQTQSVNV